MRNARYNTNQSSVLTLAGVLSLCLVGSASAQPIYFAGDVDNFGGTSDGPADDLVIRAPLANWLARSGSGGNNTAYHNGEPMPFDADQPAEGAPYDGSYDWEFGYTFENLVTLNSDAQIRIHLKANEEAPWTDGINLQYTGPDDGSSFSSLWASSLPALNGGTWNTGEEAIFTIPLGPGGANIISDINAVGYLDVYVQDDTSVDWIELTVPAPGTASLLGLGALVAMRRRR